MEVFAIFYENRGYYHSNQYYILQNHIYSNNSEAIKAREILEVEKYDENKPFQIWEVVKLTIK